MGFLSSALSGISKPRTPSVPSISSANIDRMKNVLGLRELETMPAHAARAFQLASDVRSQLSDFTDIIESDEALSARIIRIANSVYYSRGTNVPDIERAVANIGIEELRCLLSATMLRSLLSAKHPVRQQIWANSVATGVISRLLANFTAHLSPGSAFLCGLLHDVGKLVMIRRNGPLYEKVNGLVATSSPSFMEAEEEMFELNHVEVGQWIAQEWNFPEEVRRAIYFHHHPWPKTPPASVDAALLVSVADIFSHAMGIGLPAHLRGFQRRAQELLPSGLALLGIGIDSNANIIKKIESDFQEAYSQYEREFA